MSNTLEKKITFIQSAALLNCALEREQVQSTKKQIKKNLRNLCFETLLSAKARRHKFDLINFANELKKDVDKWRENVKRKVETSFPISKRIKKESLQQFKFEQQKVSDIEALQDKITEKYKEFMRKVSQMTIKVLGDLPCDFALVGMGSLARKEITPYSDFENIIVMQEGVQNDEEKYEEMLEYFRWYAVIFQVILIILGETILPSVAIPSLNDYTSEEKNWFYDAYTKRGISFDGMMPHACKSPLGRQPTDKKPWEIELIKPVSLMAEYLTQEEDLKNGYHLADILTNTCFVEGSQDVYDAFEKAANSVLREDNSYTKRVIEMIKDDMQNYSTKLNISATIEKQSYNIKQFAYRSTTIFITGISKMNNIKPGSCFEIVRKMRDRELMSEEFSNKLLYAIALACEIRLKTYLEQGFQYDYDELSVEKAAAHNVALSLIKAVGKRRCCHYLEIACCLQYDMISFFRLDSNYLFFHPVAMSIAISAFLGLYDDIIAAKNYIQNYPILQDQPAIEEDLFTLEDIDDDVFISRSNNCLDQVDGYCNQFVTDSAQQPRTISNSNRPANYAVFGKWYLETKRFNERLANFNPSPLCLARTKCCKMQNDRIGDILIEIGKYFFEKAVYFEARYIFSITLKLFEVNADSTNLCKAITCLFWIGKCLIKSKDYANADKKFSETLRLYQSLPCHQKNIENFEGDCLKEIGVCQQKLDLHDKAAKSFETALNFYHSSKSKKLEEVGFCLLNMGRCFYLGNKFGDALKQFKKLKKIYSRCESSTETLKGDCFFHIGCCLQNLSQYEKGKNTLDKAIQIYRKDMENAARSEVYKGLTLFRIGKSFNMMHSHKEAIESFSNSLHLWKKLSESYPDDKEHLLKIAVSHKLIGRCYSKYNFEEKAIEHYRKSLEFFQTLKRDKDYLTVTCKLYKFIGKAYRELENYEEACRYFRKGISDASTTTSEKILAVLNRNCGICLARLNRSDEAATYINMSLKIYQKLSKKEDTGKMERNIGLCYKYLDGFFEKSKEYLQKYINKFEDPQHLLSLKERLDMAMIVQTIGLICRDERNWESALDYFQKSLDIFQKLPKSLEYAHQIACLSNRIGEYWLCRYREKTAEKSFQNAVALSDLLSLTSKGIYMLAVSYKNLGRAFLQQRLFNKARKNFQDSEKLLSTLPNKSKHYLVIAWLFKKIGMCFKEQKWSSEAIANLKKALDLYKKMSDKEKYAEEIAFVLNNIGICHQVLQNFDKALKAFKESLLIYLKVKGHENNVAGILTDIGISYESLSRCRKANVYFKLALKAFKKLPNSDHFGEKIIFLENKLDSRQYRRSQQKKKLY